MVGNGLQDAGLRDELLHRVEIDQRARLALMPLLARATDGAVRRDDLKPEEQALFDKVIEVDRENTRWLDELVQQRGWPTRSMVGDEAAQAAWLLVQHGDQDPAWQRRCLDLMQAVPADEVSPPDVAYLTDRVLLAEGEPQIFGTQVIWTDGNCHPRNLRDADTVDERRATVGLGPLDEYLQQMTNSLNA